MKRTVIMSVVLLSGASVEAQTPFIHNLRTVGSGDFTTGEFEDIEASIQMVTVPAGTAVIVWSLELQCVDGCSHNSPNTTTRVMDLAGCICGSF